MIYILAFVFYLGIVMPAAIVWQGYALATMWSWFLVPTFHVQAISIPAAIGISAILGFVAHKVDTSKNENDTRSGGKRAFDMCLLLTLRPAVLLGIGWIVKQWM